MAGTLRPGFSDVNRYARPVNRVIVARRRLTMVQDEGRTMTFYLVVETDVFTRCVRHAVTSRDMVLERSDLVGGCMVMDQQGLGATCTSADGRWRHSAVTVPTGQARVPEPAGTS